MLELIALRMLENEMSLDMSNFWYLDMWLCYKPPTQVFYYTVVVFQLHAPI